MKNKTPINKNSFTPIPTFKLSSNINHSNHLKKEKTVK